MSEGVVPRQIPSFRGFRSSCRKTVRGCEPSASVRGGNRADLLRGQLCGRARCSRVFPALGPREPPRPEVTRGARLGADLFHSREPLLRLWACAGRPPPLAASSLRAAHRLRDVQGSLGDLHPPLHELRGLQGGESWVPAS